MSTNCIQCVVNPRTGTDLLCDECRVWWLGHTECRGGPCEPSYIYLASPYSHSNKDVMQERFEAVCRVAAVLMSEGNLIFSPIAHTHPIALAGGLPRGWDFWKRYGEVMVSHAEKLLVLKLDGWKTSQGVAAEIEIAKKRSIPVEYCEVTDE